MKVQLVTPYRVSHLQRYGVTVRRNVTSVYPPLTLILLMWRIWRAPNNARKWQMGFKSEFKGLNDSCVWYSSFQQTSDHVSVNEITF